jgi:AcrR family transcriptional regulator
MPKIIKDVEETVRNYAKILFVEFSYNDVDMKMISKKSGVAVGTLYNYYKNKKELYLSILKESWQNTFNSLDAVSELDISSGEKLKKFITTLYEDIEARNGLGKAVINTSIVELKNDVVVNDLKNNLILKIENFLNRIYKLETLDNYTKINTKLAESLLVLTLAMLEFHPNDKEDNIGFLVKLISLSTKIEMAR